MKVYRIEAVIQYRLKTITRPVVLTDAYEDSGNEHFHDSKFYAAKIGANEKPAKLAAKEKRHARKKLPREPGQLIYILYVVKSLFNLFVRHVGYIISTLCIAGLATLLARISLRLRSGFGTRLPGFVKIFAGGSPRII